MAQKAYDGAGAARVKIKALANATQWMAESTDVRMEEAFLPSSLRRLEMSLDIYRRQLVLLTSDGSLSRMDRLELQRDGENIVDSLLSETDWACD